MHLAVNATSYRPQTKTWRCVDRDVSMGWMGVSGQGWMGVSGQGGWTGVVDRGCVCGQEVYTPPAHMCTRVSHCSERYASYWDAFLYSKYVCLKMTGILSLK